MDGIWGKLIAWGKCCIYIRRTSSSHFFVLGFIDVFNIFQVISGRCLLVIEGMITTLFWQRVNQFLRSTTLYMPIIWQGSFNYPFEIFGFNRPGIEPGTSQTRSKCSTMHEDTSLVKLHAINHTENMHCY